MVAGMATQEITDQAVAAVLDKLEAAVLRELEDLRTFMNQSREDALKNGSDRQAVAAAAREFQREFEKRRTRIDRLTESILLIGDVLKNGSVTMF